MQRLAFSIVRQANRRCINIRQFSKINIPSSAVTEPEYGVEIEVGDDWSPKADELKKVKVPYMPEHTKQEMYRLHKADPIANTDSALAKQFNCSITRVRAVIYLHKHREEVRNKLLDTTDGTVKPHW